MRWKKIEGFENYSVSDTGIVKNDYTGRILHNFDNGSGYKIVHLFRDNKIINFRVHRLVAQAFISNPKNKKCVNHINGVKHDNRVENLEWCTHSQNNYHSYRVLKRSSHNAIKAMTVAKMKPVLCCEKNKIFGSIKEAATETGCFHGNISSCLKGKRKTAGGFHWGYAK